MAAQERPVDLVELQATLHAFSSRLEAAATQFAAVSSQLAHELAQQQAVCQHHSDVLGDVAGALTVRCDR